MRTAAKVCILVGSIRKDSHSLKIAGLLVSELSALGHSPETVDPRLLNLPVPLHPDDDGSGATVASQLQQRVINADAIVFITPEYDGSYSAVSKILVEMLGYPSVLAGKPVSVIGVATGSIGAYRAIEHLRSVLLHIGAVVCPSLFSLAEVHKSLGGEDKSKLKEKLRRHAQDLLRLLR